MYSNSTAVRSSTANLRASNVRNGIYSRMCKKTTACCSCTAFLWKYCVWATRRQAFFCFLVSGWSWTWNLAESVFSQLASTKWTTWTRHKLVMSVCGVRGHQKYKTLRHGCATMNNEHTASRRTWYTPTQSYIRCVSSLCSELWMIWQIEANFESIFEFIRTLMC